MRLMVATVLLALALVFGRYTEHKWTEKSLPGGPVRLRWERLRDFSDSLSRQLGE